MQCTVLHELAILLIHFMKECFNSFNDIKFFHTFSSISRDMKMVMLNEIHRYIQNFMLYKMIYFLSHKFAFSNLRFLPLYEYFCQFLSCMSEDLLYVVTVYVVWGECSAQALLVIWSTKRLFIY